MTRLSVNGPYLRPSERVGWVWQPYGLYIIVGDTDRRGTGSGVESLRGGGSFTNGGEENPLHTERVLENIVRFLGQ